MLETNGDSTLALSGINQQDFTKIQLVSGVYPYQEGLQKRLPGKTLIQLYDGQVGSIFVFYMVFGRTYTFIDFGSIEITEISVPPITLPGLPPTGNEWFDSFGSYLVDTISRIWGGGAWLNAIGICETIIDGYIDAFNALEGGIFIQTIPLEQQPHDAPPVDTPDTPPILPPVGPQYPVSCATLPDQFYQTFAIGDMFDSVQRQGGSVDVTTAANQGDPPPATLPHPYTNISGSGLEAHEDYRNTIGYDGFAWVQRARSSGYRTHAHFNIQELELPDDAQIFLVGTKSLSDGTNDGGNNCNVTSTCASLQISTVGEKSGTVDVSTLTGIELAYFINPPDEKGTTNVGTLNYTEIRVYSASYNFNF